jgi:hypothetical protein
MIMHVEEEIFLVCGRVSLHTHTLSEFVMQVGYELRDAGEEIGLGIFVTARVLKGTLVWKYCAGENVNVYDEKSAIARLEKFATKKDCQYFLDLTYGLRGLLHEIIDEGRFMNHSLTPNCQTDKCTGHTYAVRDIETDEQLFEDYTTFDHPDFLYDLLKKYQCEPDYYPLPDREEVINNRRYSDDGSTEGGKDGGRYEDMEIDSRNMKSSNKMIATARGSAADVENIGGDVYNNVNVNVNNGILNLNVNLEVLANVI